MDIILPLTLENGHQFFSFAKKVFSDFSVEYFLFDLFFFPDLGSPVVSELLLELSTKSSPN